MKIMLVASAAFDNAEKIASNIEHERKKAGYESASDAARAFGVSRPTYSKFENAKEVKKRTIEELEKLAYMFGCPVERFFME